VWNGRGLKRKEARGGEERMMIYDSMPGFTINNEIVFTYL
jgi:hypothetical protein